MKLKFAAVFRIYVFALVFLLGWSVWRIAMAQAPAALVITSPEGGARFSPGTNITVRAELSAPTNRFNRVEFRADGQLIGISSNAPHSITWSNVSNGRYVLTAAALGDGDDSMRSEEVRIRVYNTYLSFGLDRVTWLERPMFDIPLWQYCASLIYIFLAFYVSKTLDFLTRVWLKKWAARTTTTFDDLLLELLNGPIKVVSFVIFLRIGLEVFSWPPLLRTILPKGFAIIVAISLTYMALKFIDLVMSYWRKRTHGETDRAFDEQLFPIVRKSLKVFVVVVAVLVTFSNIGIDITAAIASLSIGGLAIGLAAQDTLANLFGAVAVFVDKPFRVGDRIQLDSIDGTVESIGLRSTRVRNLDGHLITVPNKMMGNAAITNITRRPNIKTVMNLGITYDTPVAKVNRALEILETIYKRHPKTHDLIISFDKFADSSLNILVVHWWNSTDHREYLGGMRELNLQIKEQFDQEEINFAFPTRTLYVKQDSDWRVANGGAGAARVSGSGD